MIWQDVVLMIINFIFGIILIPQALDMYRGRIPMNKISCSVTFILLIVVGAVFITLNLWLSMAAEFANAVIWGIMSYLAWRNGSGGNNNIKIRGGISHPSWL